MTLGTLIEEALRGQLATDGAERPSFKLVTFGKGGAHRGVDLDRTSALIAEDDAAAFGGRGGSR